MQWLGFVPPKRHKTPLKDTGDFFNNVAKEASKVASTGATIALVCYAGNWVAERLLDKKHRKR
jgi:hypothetical protein